MRNFIAVVVVVALIGYVTVQWANVYKARSDLAQVVTQQLNFVDENSQAAVKQRLVDEARKLGIDLAPDDIHITYEDTDIRSMAQRYTSKIATFINKRAVIQLSYNARLVGISLHQKIGDSKLKQIQAQERQSEQTKEILDGTQ
jgi:hypothetical protein